MEYIEDFQFLVAGSAADGAPAFLDVAEPSVRLAPGSLELTWLWDIAGVPDIPSRIGSVPSSMRFPLPPGIGFGVTCFPAHSAGTRDMRKEESPSIVAGEYEDVSFHRTNTVDFQIILSGKIDLELPSGDTRTLVPGTCMVMGGVAHAWRNHYDEDCVFASVTIGATASRRSGRSVEPGKPGR